MVPDIAQQLLDAMADDGNAAVIQPHLGALLDSLTRHMLGAGAGKVRRAAFTQAELTTLSRIMPFAEDGTTSQRVVTLLLPFLGKETKLVPEKQRLAILETVLQSEKLFGGGVRALPLPAAASRSPPPPG